MQLDGEKHGNDSTPLRRPKEDLESRSDKQLGSGGSKSSLQKTAEDSEHDEKGF